MNNLKLLEIIREKLVWIRDLNHYGKTNQIWRGSAKKNQIRH